MCSHYQALKEHSRYVRHFGVEPPAEPGRDDLWPGYVGSFIRRHPHADVGDEAVPAGEALAGVFGLIPHWSADTRIARHTYNARSETVAEKPSFREAWKRGQHCIIPAEAIYEPDWRSGRAVATRISRADGAPMGLAGLWSYWRSPEGAPVFSYTMLTLNADAHPLMRNFHKPGEEKRMVVVLPEHRYEAWLQASAAQSPDFLQCYPTDGLVAAHPDASKR